MAEALDSLSGEQLLALIQKEQDEQVRKRACVILCERLGPDLVQWIAHRSNEELLPLTGKGCVEHVRKVACETLYRRLGPDLIKWVEHRLGGSRNGDKKFEPKDAVQMFFVHVLEGKIAAKYDGQGKVEPFFRRIIENAAIDCVKREGKYHPLPPGDQSASSDGLQLKIEVAEVRERLSEDEQLVCDEYLMEDKSAQEVADAHPERNWTDKDVYAIAARVKKQFKELDPSLFLLFLTPLIG